MLTADRDVSVEAVLVYDVAEGEWVKLDDELWADDPGEPDKNHTITFANEFEGEQYKVKYKWYSSQKPEEVTLSNPE